MRAYRFVTKRVVVNTFYIYTNLPRYGFRKVLDSKSDLQGHSRSLIFGAIRQATYDFILVFNCNYVSISHRFLNIITYLPKLE